MKHATLWIGSLVATLLAGCTMTPHYQRPAAPVDVSYPEQIGTEQTVADIDWHSFYADPKLRSLIELALTNNRDLRVSVLNIQQARAQYRVQRAQSWPQVDANSAVNANRTPASLSVTGEPMTSRQYSANIGASF